MLPCLTEFDGTRRAYQGSVFQDELTRLLWLASSQTGRRPGRPGHLRTGADVEVRMGLLRPLQDEGSTATPGTSRLVAATRRRTYRGGAWTAALAIFFAQSLLAQPPWDACDSAAAMAQAFVGQWRELLSNRGSLSAGEFADRSGEQIDRTVAVDLMALEIFQGDWERMRPADRNEFLQALQVSLRQGLVVFLEREMRGTVPTLVPGGARDDRSTVEYSLETPNGKTQALRLKLAGVGGGACKIVDVEYDGDGLLREYRKRVDDLIDDYSFPYMLAKLANRDYLILEDFESSPVGELPEGWGWRDGDANKDKPYRVRQEGGNRYLEATDEGQSVILGREVRWDLNEYPYISFRLRVHRIPEGGDERIDERVDSAAGVYITIKKVAFGRIPESVKYVWSSTLPVGAATRREGLGRPWQVVVGSGKDGLGE